ncbi:MAG: c-type cytochrome [Sphingomicrobium sp.]
MPPVHALLPLLLLATACKPPPEQRPVMPAADAARGKQAIERVGCGSCHAIEGIAWPKGAIGPPLDGLAGRAAIAGRVPNRPDLLAAFIRNAPAVAPGTTMPAMPLNEQESRDVAAYLYEIGD